MKASELRDKSAEELSKELKSLLREQFNLRMQSGMGDMAQTHQFKFVRRAIARVKTILNERSRADG